MVMILFLPAKPFVINSYFISHLSLIRSAALSANAYTVA